MKLPIGHYCKIYGNNTTNRVIEYFLECEYTMVAIGDMAKDIGISRPKAYQIVDEFLKKGYVVKDRVIGKTQLYRINKENSIVKIFIRNFNECLNMVANEYSKSHSSKVPEIIKVKPLRA